MSFKICLHKKLLLSTLSIGLYSPAVVNSEATPRRHRACAIGTWTFGAIAVETSSSLLQAGGAALDAVEEGIKSVELNNDDQYWVGKGGFPNSDGVMELDAALMDSESRYGLSSI